MQAFWLFPWIPMEFRIWKKTQTQVNLLRAFFRIRIPQIILISLKTAALFLLL